MTAGADYYAVEGVTEQGLMVSCITNDTYCALYNMECGQMYNISISASNHVCQDMSTSTEPVMIKTGEKKLITLLTLVNFCLFCYLFVYVCVFYCAE